MTSEGPHDPNFESPKYETEQTARLRTTKSADVPNPIGAPTNSRGRKKNRFKVS